MGVVMSNVMMWLLLRIPLSRSSGREAGAAVVEYALLLAFITLVAFAAIVFIGNDVQHGLSSSGSSIFNSP